MQAILFLPHSKSCDSPGERSSPDPEKSIQRDEADIHSSKPFLNAGWAHLNPPAGGGGPITRRIGYTE
jgi:hypothetical protein